MCGTEHVINHDAIPAACFTHPEIAMVGPTEEQARERAEKEGYEIGVSQGSFKANSKALAEGEGEGIAKVRFETLSTSAQCITSRSRHRTAPRIALATASLTVGRRPPTRPGDLQEGYFRGYCGAHRRPPRR